MERLHHLIFKANGIVDDGFDFEEFCTWKTLASLTLETEFGSEHFYTRIFDKVTIERSFRSVLAGKGVLIAASRITATNSRYE
jgi:hypothetical protein